jgi:hypothetical protein
MQTLILCLAGKACYIIGFSLILLIFLSDSFERQVKADHPQLVKNKDHKP